MEKTKCEKCGREVAGYEIISVGSIDAGYRDLCTQCFNGEAAVLDGLEKFEHAAFAPVAVTDCDGEVHEFHFRTRLFGPGVALDAFEVRNGEPAGYEFQAIGEPEADPMALLARLIEKIRRALAVKHIEAGDYGPRIADHQIVRGRIAWDEAEEGRVPIVVVDGREFTWEQLGRMMMTYEGWQFKLEIRDRSEEV